MKYIKYKGKERDFQIAVATYLDFRGLLWAHAPNGGTRNKSEAASLKRQGVKSGFPDVCILEPNKDYHGLFIELKVGCNKPSPNQIYWLDRLKIQGYKTAVSYSFDEVKHIISEYMKIK